MTKKSIHQEYIIINIYTSNIRAPKYLKQTLTEMNREIHSNTTGDFNTPLSIMDRISKQMINKETGDLTNTTDQMDLTDIYRIFHPHSGRIHVLLKHI